MEASPYYTTTEAAQVLGVTTAMVVDRIVRGHLPAQREAARTAQGFRYLVRKEEIDALRGQVSNRRGPTRYRVDDDNPERIAASDAATLLNVSRQYVSQLRTRPELDWNGASFSRSAIEKLVKQRKKARRAAA